MTFIKGFSANVLKKNEGRCGEYTILPSTLNYHRCFHRKCFRQTKNVINQSIFDDTKFTVS